MSKYKGQALVLVKCALLHIAHAYLLMKVGVTVCPRVLFCSALAPVLCTCTSCFAGGRTAVPVLLREPWGVLSNVVCHPGAARLCTESAAALPLKAACSCSVASE